MRGVEEMPETIAQPIGLRLKAATAEVTGSIVLLAGDGVGHIFGAVAHAGDRSPEQHTYSNPPTRHHRDPQP